MTLLLSLGGAARLDADEVPRETIERAKFPCPENETARYTAHRVSEPIRIDGRLDEAVWQRAPRSPRFIDILTGAPTTHDTHAMVVWDNTNLYVAYRIQEPFVHAIDNHECSSGRKKSGIGSAPGTIR